MKKAFVIYGPESSATRLFTKILIYAGCYGECDHYQQFDDHLDASLNPIVWRRSFPHAGGWPVIKEMIDPLRAAGYDVKAIVTTRGLYPVVHSQIGKNYAQNEEEALKNIQKAYHLIFTELGVLQVPFFVVSYASLVLWPKQTIDTLCQFLGLNPPSEYPVIFDGNAKWYDSLDIPKNKRSFSVLAASTTIMLWLSEQIDEWIDWIA